MFGSMFGVLSSGGRLGVADIEAADRQMIERGAAPRDPIQDVGEGIKVAAVTDPFGNAIGLIENLHFAAK